MNRYIVLDENDIVLYVRYGTSIVEGEVESALGEAGQQKQADGTFVDLSQPQKQPSLEEMQAQILLNTEYLVVMSEINNGE